MMSLLFIVPVTSTPAVAIERINGVFPNMTIEGRVIGSALAERGILGWRLDEFPWKPLPDNSFHFGEGFAGPFSLRFTKREFEGICVQAGVRTLWLRFQHQTGSEESEAASRSFFVEEDYCGPGGHDHPELLGSAILRLTEATGLFPDFTLRVSFTLSSYSGLAYIWMDDGIPEANSDRQYSASMNAIVTLGQSGFFDYYCLREGSHTFFLQLQSPTYGNSNIISYSFTLGWDFGCGSGDAGLILKSSSTNFPDLVIGYRAVVFGTYSGVLSSKIDDEEWSPVISGSTGRDYVVSSTTPLDTNMYVYWKADDFDCVSPGYHTAYLQVRNETLGNSNVISVSFYLYSDFKCGTRTPSPTRSPPLTHTLKLFPSLFPHRTGAVAISSPLSLSAEFATQSSAPAGMAIGAIAGIVVSSIAVVGAVAGVIIWCVIPRRTDSHSENSGWHKDHL
jgi:hypothetical protein